MIHVVTTLRKEGKTISALSELGAVIPSYVKYIGHAVGRFAAGGQQVEMPYEFEIDAATPMEAFDKFQSCARAAGERMQRQIEEAAFKQRLIGG